MRHHSAMHRPRVINARNGAKMLIVVVALAPLLVPGGCGRPAPTLQPDDRPRAAAGRSGNDARDKADALLQDMARYIFAADADVAGSPAQVRVVTFGPFINRTNLAAPDFARFRADFQQLLKQRSRSVGLLFADEGPQAGPSRYELQASALPIGAESDEILLRLALVGPGRDRQPTPIWSDAVTLPRP